MLDQVNKLVNREWTAIEAVLSPESQPPGPAIDPNDLDAIFNPPFSAPPVNPLKIVQWSWRISPGFPSPWPMTNSSELHFYAYAAGIQPMVLCDGEWYTPVWAKVRASITTGQLNLDILDPAPAKKGAQGMRPLRPEEIPVMNDKGVVEDFAHALANGPIPPSLAKRVRAYYLQWCGFHAVAREIEVLHPQFFEWLRN